MNAPVRIEAGHVVHPVHVADVSQMLAAEQITAIVDRELAGRRWSASARADLAEIKSLATGVLDHVRGHEGFDDCPAALDDAVTDWSERVDYRTFANVALQVAS